MTENILYFDCFSGIAGDMTMAALVELGVPQDYLLENLVKLNVQGYHIHFVTDARKGIHGLRADVILEHEENTHVEHHHHHEEKLTEHHHRNFLDIKEIFENSSLNENVKKTSLAIFQKVADAEGKIHGKPADEVHFHEVGAIDSIVDIAAAAICLDYLKPDRILCSTIEMGGGFVKCAHGLMPVPAPATLEILKGIPVKSGAVPFETTTPTGAAILAVCVDEFTDNKNFIPEKTAYGVGHRDTDIPNVLRVTLAKPSEKNVKKTNGEAVILECNIDDMNPELYSPLMTRFFEAGASDVYLTPIIMKKGRPAVKISVLCRPDRKEILGKMLLTETSTFGYRTLTAGKTELERTLEEKHTSLGPVRVKTGFLEGRKIKSKPEIADVIALADNLELPVSEVYNRIKGETNES